jgi:hypothetical protein
MKRLKHLATWVVITAVVASAPCYGTAPEKISAEGLHRHALGVCDIVNVGPGGIGHGEMFPVLYANSFYFKAATTSEEKIDFASATVDVIRPPKHGFVKAITLDGDWRNPIYIPNDGFLGHDSFVLRVRGNGYSVELHHFFHVTDDRFVTFNPNRTCKGHTWKIAITTGGDIQNA